MASRVPSVKPGKALRSERTGRTYRVGPVIARGGFGAVHECTLEGRPRATLAVKLTQDQDSWVTELYFSRLTKSLSNGILPIWDAFPTRLQPRGQTTYAIVEPRAAGTLADLIEEGPRSEAWVIRQFKTLLVVLARLHVGGAVHRDLTPMNVFFDSNNDLMLGDFGIAFHSFAHKGVTATKFNPYFIPPEVKNEDTFIWSPRQDVWQVGQLLAMALLGEPDQIRPKDVKRITCVDWLGQTIYRAISGQQHRFDNARQMLSAMQARVAAATLLPLARRPTLKNKNIVFTAAIPNMPRAKASAIARRRGAHVLHDISFDTDYLVVGGTSRLWATGSAGSKIMEAVVKNERTAHIQWMTAAQFLRLVGR